MADYHKIELIMSLRNQGIRNTKILGAIERIPREIFVPENFVSQAYVDDAIPIDCGQTISQPYIVAYMTDKLELKEDCKVLEIGTGSGYQAAILASLCSNVCTIERHEQLAIQAREHFAKLNIENIELKVGDGNLGWSNGEQFSRIIVTASTEEIPKSLLEQLDIGGIMIIPVGSENRSQELIKVVRTNTGYEYTNLLRVKFVPLVAGMPHNQSNNG